MSQNNLGSSFESAKDIAIRPQGSENSQLNLDSFDQYTMEGNSMMLDQYVHA